MASYVPPHKRLSSNQVGPPPTPALMDPQTTGKKSLIAMNAEQAIYRCFAFPLQDDGRIPSSVHLVPTSVKDKVRERLFTLVDDHAQQDCHLKRPWVSVAEKMHSDLLSAFQNVKDEMANASLEKTIPGVFARFGKVLYSRRLSLSADQPNLISETHLGNSKRRFHTDVPVSYVEHIKNEAVPEIGIHFGGMKEKHQVKFFVMLNDTERPRSIICKCRIQEGGQKLELYRIETCPLRHLIVDTSCLDSHVDLRLALQTKRDLTAVITEEEMQSIGVLISSAIVDPNVKGSLRWPLGVANSRARYSVTEFWHIKNVLYVNSSMRLTVREVDRYNCVTSTGSVSKEIFLKLTGVRRGLMEENDAKAVSTMLEDTLKMIWEHFLKWDGNLVSYSES